MADTITIDVTETGDTITVETTTVAGSFTMASIDHDVIQNVGTNTHAQIDAFIGGSITTVGAATYTILSTDSVLHVTYSSTGACTITFPTALMTSGNTITIKDAGFNAGMKNITLETEGSQTIDGDTNWTINGDGDWLKVYCDGSNLFIIS